MKKSIVPELKKVTREKKEEHCACGKPMSQCGCGSQEGMGGCCGGGCCCG